MKPPCSEECVARGRPKLDELLRIARDKKTLLAQTHDYPDPDTIASALALGWLLRELAGLEATVGYGGIIGRAENKAMCRILNIKMKRTAPADFHKYDLVALLDTQPEVGNHAVPLDRPPDIVFDHHFPRDLTGPEPDFFDVGGEYGATSTKVVELVMASGLTPPTNIATALFYGVKSDTMNLARDASKADVAAYLFLFPLVDSRVLSEIEHPQVPLDYFRVFNTAISRARIHGNMIVADLGSVYTPDLCAEVADRLLQIEGIQHAMSIGWYEESIFLSVRTRARNRNAGRILHGIVAGGGLGTAGGHGPMAGARIPVDHRSQRARSDIRRRVVREVVSAFGQEPRHFQRVVSRKDIGGEELPPPPRSLVLAEANKRRTTARAARAARAEREERATEAPADDARRDDGRRPRNGA